MASLSRGLAVKREMLQNTISGTILNSIEESWSTKALKIKNYDFKFILFAPRLQFGSKNVACFLSKLSP